MIAHVHGTVAHRDPNTVVVDVGGIGYLVHVTPSEHLPARGERIELFTSLQVREESMTLYGFTHRSSLLLFEQLLTSSGVGPKLALAALGTHRPDVLRSAIAGGDLKTLTAIPGVGKKVAERLVLELKDKVGAVPELPGDAAAAPSGGGDTAPRAEVREALLGLGYSTAEVQRVLAELPTGDDDVAQLLRLALRSLGANAFDGARG